MRSSFIGLLSFLVLASPGTRAAEPSAARVDWQEWSDAVFARARKENRLVILDLEAVWCHWCHVMDAKTYGDPRVAAILRERYIAVKVDQDARPDISKRYEDWGWPATIVFAPDGTELAKRRGYILPEAMAAMLTAFVESPTPGPSVVPAKKISYAAEGALTPNLRRELERAHVETYDAKQGSWGFGHKYVDAESVEYALDRARDGDAAAEKRARQTLTAGLALLDPAWGGVYQYSTGGVWNEPHFEKIVSMQAASLRIYTLGARELGNPAYLVAARAIRRYLNDFLRSPEGAYYVSQDADRIPGEHGEAYFALDDAERRALGVPRVDASLYARENGWVIEALAALHGVTREPEVLEDARRAAEWVAAHRALPGGGFSHGDADSGGPFLADTLATGRAFLALHDATGDLQWLRRAEDAARFIARTFRAPGAPGFASAATVTSAAAAGPAVVPPRDENALLARFAFALARRTKDRSFDALAREAMRVVATPALARQPSVGPVLLADRELRPAPVRRRASAAP